MKVAIAGGTGLIGKALTDRLTEQGHSVIILTRKERKRKGVVKYVQWLNEGDNPEYHLEGIDVFINLAGESLNSGRWTKQRKERILQSRLIAVQEMTRIVRILKEKPKTILNASAVGYYGPSANDIYDETSIRPTGDFLSRTVHLWEAEVNKLNETEDIRIVLMRMGVVLAEGSQALRNMVIPYKLFAGGTVGRGNQWLSWIHIEDIVQASMFCIEHESISGPVNFTAPQPATMKTAGKAIGSALQRPHWLPVPSFALRLALGEMSTLVLDGQNVIPKKLLDAGYLFRYPVVSSAMDNILH
ncbi:MAG: TIGR01777 family oxidoreductase [Bacillus sp. (in: firmicutes)]